jgi:hypothetical protein
METFLFLMFHPIGLALWMLGCTIAAIIAMILIDR